MIHIYTGDGKGKTTACVGLSLRALGGGLRVFFAQFIKDGSSSEIAPLRAIGGEHFTYFSRGRGKFIVGTPSEEDRKRAAETLTALTDALRSGKYDVVAADEIFGSLQAGLFPLSALLDLLDCADQFPERELVLTGRNAPPEAVARAGLVTEMKCVKHYYSAGRAPKQGIEW